MLHINPEPVIKKNSPYSRQVRLSIEKKKLDFHQAKPASSGPSKFKIPLANLKKYNWKTVSLILIIVIALSSAIFVALKVLLLKNQVIVENTSGSAPVLKIQDPKDLTTNLVNKDGDTRINVLITGIGGKGHDGGSLTDSIQVLSIDPFNKKAGIISLPRDLYLTLADKSNRKINTVYQVGESQKPDGGGSLSKETIGQILDLKIHYFINIDFEGFIKLVDRFGGVSVNVEKAIADSEYPDKQLKGFDPFYLKAGKQTLNGETALKYARSRKTTSDFDRSRRQQQLMIALKEKALSLGTLANPAKINDIVNIIGSHIKTDIQVDEMQLLASRYQEINSENITTLVIDNGNSGPLKNGNIEGSYVLIPKLGLNKYDEVQNLTHKTIIDPKVAEEAATIEIVYPKSQKKTAQALLDRLTSYGYTVSDGGELKNGSTQTKNQLISRTQDSPFTANYLVNRLTDYPKKEEKKTSDQQADFIIIVGGK